MKQPNSEEIALKTTDNKSSKKQALEQIVADLYQLDAFKSAEARRNQLESFIDEAINGDTSSEAHLVVSANLGANKKGALIYILTDLRLIKVDIDAASFEMKSGSFPVKTITAVERKLVDDRAEVQVNFQSGSFGLRYTPNNSKIVEFFQKVEQCQSRSEG